MSDHEAPTTEPTFDQAPADEAPATEAPERVDQAHQIAELEDAWRRTAAELDNFRKRCARDVVLGRQQERALEHASSDPDSVVEGVRAVLAQAVDVLADLGYPRRDDNGRAFDPAVHEAVGTVSGEGLVPGTVAEVVRPGYGPDDNILRPGAVVVATRAS
jgi:molecular chaperone GrpE